MMCLLIQVSTSREEILLGTACSGLEVPVVALQNGGVPFHHAFSIEVDKHVRAMIEANHKPGQMFEDIFSVSVNKLPRVDIFAAGFPSQPYSWQGKQQGPEDEKGARSSFRQDLGVSSSSLPRCVPP